MNIDPLTFFLFLKIRALVYRTLAAWDRFVGNVNPLVIYCYHSVGTDWRFSVSPAELKKQMYHLAANATPVSLTDIEQYLFGKKQLPQPAFAVTFDDGYEDVYQSKQLFQRLAIKPTVFVMSNSRNVNRTILETQKTLLSPEKMKLLKKAGWQIGCHSATHSVLTNTNRQKLQKEIVESKRKLEKATGAPVSYFAYPKGRYSPAVLDVVARAGYRLAVTMNDGMIDRATARLTLPRVGVDGTHTFAEFQTLASPSVVAMRKFVKHSVLGKHI